MNASSNRNQRRCDHLRGDHAPVSTKIDPMHGRKETRVGWYYVVQVAVWFGPSASCKLMRRAPRPALLYSAETFERFGNAFRGRYVQFWITRERGKVRDEENVGQIVDEKFEQRRVGVLYVLLQLSHPLVAGPPARP
jgi:hypothetical protein